MTPEQITIFAILGAALVLFVWQRWRFDVVAVMALLACVVTGLVEPTAAFAGFGHPAVITVAAVLAIWRALSNSELISLWEDDPISEPTLYALPYVVRPKPSIIRKE